MPASGSTKAAPVGAAFLFVLALMLLPAACAGPGAFGGSREAVVAWSAQRGFAVEALNAGDFVLLALVRGGPSRRLRIYIEGDGASWPSPWQPPDDPTPEQPIALEMAAADFSSAIAYLGRPCQYLDHGALAACSGEFWTVRRFSPEVLAAFMTAVDRLKSSRGAERIELVGHSGGGVIAALLAMRRGDVERVITVAAPLAVGEWTRHHNVSELTGSLDPGAMTENLRAGSVVHFVGESDKVVPPALVEQFARRKGGRVVRVPAFDHECCWARDWARLLGSIG